MVNYYQDFATEKMAVSIVSLYGELRFYEGRGSRIGYVVSNFYQWEVKE